MAGDGLLAQPRLGGHACAADGHDGAVRGAAADALRFSDEVRARKGVLRVHGQNPDRVGRGQGVGRHARDVRGARAALARRKGGVWYAAAVGNAAAQTVRFETAFLGTGTWRAEIFRDADDAEAEPTHYVHETETVRAGEAQTFRLAPGGGFVARFTRTTARNGQ